MKFSLKQKVKAKLKKHFSKTTRRRLRIIIANLSFGFSNNLTNLGIIYQTDKGLGHNYIQHYMTHFKKFKYKKINLLEIGIGGYDNPKAGGNSLRMWKKYFPFARIFGLDIYDKSALQEKRIKIFQGSQVDKVFLDTITKQTGGIDIIIDDGSHINEHIIETFQLLFPKLKDGGIYAVEDVQTSYWPHMGGDSENLKNSKTAMNYFKSLADCLNNKEFLRPHYLQTYFDKKIISIHFYHNLIFIYKGNNDEKSTMVMQGDFVRKSNV